MPMQIGQGAAQSWWWHDIDMELHVCVDTKIEKAYRPYQEGNVVE